MTPGFVGSDVDLANLPHARVTTEPIAMRYSGRPRTMFRFTSFAIDITASNDVHGIWIDADRHGDCGCGMPPPPLHRARAITTDEWRHLVWLVDLADIEHITPRHPDALVDAMEGACHASFLVSSPEGDIEVDDGRNGGDNLVYVVEYMRELAGDGF